MGLRRIKYPARSSASPSLSFLTTVLPYNIACEDGQARGRAWYIGGSMKSQRQWYRRFKWGGHGAESKGNPPDSAGTVGGMQKQKRVFMARRES
jgi:hypothetical protein